MALQHANIMAALNGRNGVAPKIGYVRLIMNGEVLRQKKYQCYSQSKKLITEFTNIAKSQIQNDKNVIYLEVTKY